MKITKIRRLVSFGYMENIQMECEVKEDESVSMAVDYLESEIKKAIFTIEQKKKDEQSAHDEKYKKENPEYFKNDDEMPF